jgi:hypothetical protein
MEINANYKGIWWILALMGIGIAFTILLCFLIPTVNGEMFVYGSAPNYSAVILTNNSYVHQGENISQGYFYDLRGVYGFSGELAHWNNDDAVGQGTPDQIVTLDGRGKTYINPITFPIGRWWQWDGDYCTSDFCSSGFGHGNAYAFYVCPEQSGNASTLREKTIVQTSSITILQNGESIQIPVTYTQVETYYVTPVPTTVSSGSGTITLSQTETPLQTIAGPINPDVQDRNGLSIPGGVAGATVVTQKSPVWILIPMFAVIIVLIVRRRKE